MIVQLKLAPAELELNATPVVAPEQIVSGNATTVGPALTEITTSVGTPGQPLDDGVIE